MHKVCQNYKDAFYIFSLNLYDKYFSIAIIGFCKSSNTADVAESVDATDLKSVEGNLVWVQVPPPAPNIFMYIATNKSISHHMTS